ncbi:MAG: hypothetical protein ACPG4N_08450 [Gammaproteobacteria bacterium]
MNRLISTVGAGLLCASLLSACSGPVDDVRVSFCKDMAAELLGGPKEMKWTGGENRTPPHDDLSMRLDYIAVNTDGSETEGNVVCVFELEVEKESSMADLQPLAAYASVPHKVSLNDEGVSAEELAKLIQDTMRRRGQEFINEVKKSGNKAVSELSNALDSVLKQ